MDKPILVTGASGFIGHEVARQLAESGRRARLMIHRPHRAAYLRGLSDDVVLAKLEDPESLRRAVEGIGAVIHLAGHATFEAYRVVRPTLVDGTEALARAALSAGASRFVFASSTLVHDGKALPIDERTPLSPWTGYGRAKVEAEQRLRRITANSAMSLAMLRLPHVYGARDAMLGMARRGLLVSPGRGDLPVSHLQVTDAARALIAAASGSWTGASPIADDHPASWREFIALLRSEMPRLREVRVPAFAASVGARFPALVARLRGRPTLLTPEAVAGWNRSIVVRQGVLWRELGLVPRYPTIDSGIPAAASERLSGDWLHPVHDRRR